MFKLPALPASSGSKRKFNDIPTPEEMKRYRPDDEAQPILPPPTNGTANSRAPTVADENEEMEREEANGLEDQGGPDDEEGRFFGGGLNTEQNQILDIFDRAVDDESGPVSAADAA